MVRYFNLDYLLYCSDLNWGDASSKNLRLIQTFLRQNFFYKIDLSIEWLKCLRHIFFKMKLNLWEREGETSNEMLTWRGIVI